MKALIFLMIFSAAQLVTANSNDFGSSDTDKKPIPIDKMRYQIEIKGEILVFDKTGQRLLYKGDESRSWKFGNDKPIVSNWSYKQKNLPEIAIRHEWNLDNDGRLSAKLKQYDSMERGKDEDAKTGKLLKEKDFKIENLESISWIASQDDNKRVVVKFEPIFWVDKEPSDVGLLPINSSRMTVYDKKGNLWASRLDNSDGRNVYFGVTTHMGTFYVSFAPFKGAKEIGIAEKGLIRLEDNGTKLQIESSDPFLPRGISAKVYGLLDLNKRTDKPNSIRSYGSDNEEAFLKKINR